MSRIVKVPGVSRYIDLDAIISITEPKIVFDCTWKWYNISYEIVCRLMEKPIEIVSCYNLAMIPMQVVDEDGTEMRKEEWRSKGYIGWYDMTVYKNNPLFKEEVATKFGLDMAHPVLEEDGTCLKYEQAKQEFETLLKMWRGE